MLLRLKRRRKNSEKIDQQTRRRSRKTLSQKPRLEDNGDILACDRRIDDMEFTEQDRGSRLPPAPQGGPTSTNLEGARAPAYFPGHPSGSTHTQINESSMPQPGTCSASGCRSPAAASPAASQLKAEGRGGSNTDYINNNNNNQQHYYYYDDEDIPPSESEGGEHHHRRGRATQQQQQQPPAGLAEPAGGPLSAAAAAANPLLNQKSVIVSCCVVSSPPPSSRPEAAAMPPKSGGGEPPLLLSALTTGPHEDTDVNDTDDTPPSAATAATNNNNKNPTAEGAQGCYRNAISANADNRSSTTTTTPAASAVAARCQDYDVSCPVSSTSSRFTRAAGCTSECPPAADGRDNAVPAATTAVSATAVTRPGLGCPPIKMIAGRGDLAKPSKTRLSQDCVLPVTGWILPPGGGLRGGAPLPGETSAIANGTSGWGPPPAASVHASGTGAWGSAPPPNNGTGAWGSAAANGIGGPGGAGDDPSVGAVGGVGQGGGGGPNNQKLLNPASVSASVVGGGVATSAAASSSQQPASSAPPSAVVGGTTSWAAAAGKGLPPQTEPSANGAANKPIEVLNSLREALYSPDGWGGQNVKQDTSWDVGGSVPEPAVPPLAVKQDAMQWQSASTGRNDGTDLWKSNLSGVPPPVKPQPTTPWGNHTPAHPADYKTWGEPEDDAGDRRGGGGGNGGGGDGGGGGPNNWNDDSGVGNAGPSGAGSQPWDTDSGKKEDNWGNAASNHQWGPGAPASNMQMEPRMDGGGGGGGGGSGWGAPPPVKPSGGPGGAGSWGGGPPRGSGADQWHNDSPSAGRRMDDGGTSIWGKNGGVQGVAPGGGWKDMPLPNMGPRAPPGPPNRMPPGPGMKPGDPSPWGTQPLQGRGWGDDSLASANPWDGGDKARADMGPGGGLSAGGGGGASANPVDFWNKKPIRTSPSWEDAAGSGNGMAGAGGADARGWGGSRAPPFTKESILMSKQFRVLCEMGFRKEDAETALRNTNMQLEDAIDMLNMNRGSQMPNRGGMPPTADPSGFMGGGAGGPRGGDSGGYDMRYPGGGGGGMPYPPGGDMPPNNPSLQPNNTSRGSMNPALVQQMPMMPVPPRPTQSGTPSTSQLRLLVQQIQMAVQAGHLNAQILNQPLAPQTLLLLNQLLQQIKLLQQCKNQQQQCMTSAGNRNNQSNQAALLHLSVQITKHNQNITNLQNQITVQQAQYLKSQQPAAAAPPGALPPPPSETEQLNLNLGNLQLGGGAQDQQQQQQQQQQQTGSKLNKWIKNDNPETEFSRAPGSSKSSTSQPSPNVLLEGGSTWSNGNNGVGGGSGGWPDSADKSGNNNSADDSDNFGIPEFVPGKAWKGSSLKDPSEDPTLTPGSVAANPLLHTQPHSADNKVSSTGVISSSQANTSINNSSVENSLGLTNTTWSFGNNAVSKDGMSNGGVGGGWGGGLPPSSSTSNLTTMGQDLWGMPPRSAAKQPTGWPAGSMTTNGWSNGTNMPGGGVGGNGGGTSSWLLLKNLTAQIDGSTLRTLCMQHGPLNNFQLFLTHGIALAKYSNASEAKKAQNALNNCVLGNTTILALVTDEHEVDTIVRSLSQGGGRTAAPATSTFPNYSAAQQIAKSSSADSWSNLWSTGGGGGGVSSVGGSVWGAPDDQHNRTTPLNSFIPTDLLSETM